MSDENTQHGEDHEAAGVPPIGTQLRQAREARGLSLSQVSSETRIAERHLELIEAGQLDDLPGRTYAIGFAKNYARVVGLSQSDVAQAVKLELAAQDDPRPSRGIGSYDPVDPDRVPSSRIGLVSALALVLLLGGAYAFYATYLNPGVELESLTEEERRAAAAQAEAEGEGDAAEAAPDPSGQVVFTALEEGIWVKFYDASGAQLMQKQMAEGERYVVPADADGPQVWTGRPDALAITIGGQDIPKLAEEDQVMKDIPVTAEALLARGESPEAPGAAE